VALNVRGEEAKASEPNKPAAEAPVILIDTATGKAVHGFSLARNELVGARCHEPFSIRAHNELIQPAHTAGIGFQASTASSWRLSGVNIANGV
jgi:hypothetical protein